MALVLKDRVKETTTTAGTGTVTLAGAVTGYQSFSAIGNGNTTYYCIAGQSGSEWEVGIGTYTSSGTTLSRDTVLASSNAGSLVTFSAGTKDVFVTYPASEATPTSVYGYTTTATAAGTTTLTATSTYLQYFTGSTTQTVQMPVTSTLSLGWSFHIVNNSTGNLTVNSSGGNLIGTVLPGTTAHITCVDITVTTAAGWDFGYTDFGSATGTGSVVLSDKPSIVSASAITAGTQNTYALTVGNSSSSDFTIGSDGTYVYLQSWGGRTLRLNDQGNPIEPRTNVKIYSQTSLSGAVSTSYALGLSNNNTGSADFTVGSDASFVYVETWNTKPLRFGALNGGTAQFAQNVSFEKKVSLTDTPTNTVPVLSLTGTPNGAAGGKTGVLAVGTNFTASDKNIMASFVQDINDYTQVIVQNPNAGTSASADFIVNNDNTTGAGVYGDFGINSSNYVGSGPFALPDAVYLYSNGGDLVIGTNTAHAIRFVANNGASDAATFSSGGILSLATPLGIGSGGTGKGSGNAAITELEGFTSTVTSGGTTTLTNTSTYKQFFTGSANQTITLPSTSTLAQGWSFHIVNNSTGTLTVQTSTAVSLGTIPTHVTAMPTALTTSGNTATDWEFGLTDFGTSTGTGAVTLNSSPTINFLNLGAGTTASPPLDIAAGTNLTTPAAGAVEYDGAAFYATTDTSGGRGFLPTTQTFFLTANGANISTIANFFGATSNISLVANAFYDIEIVLICTKNTAGTITWTLTNSAAPTQMVVDYEMSPVTGIVAPPGTATMLRGQAVNVTAAAYTVATASITNNVSVFARFRLLLRNGNGTSLQIRATAGAGTITPLAGSRWFCRRLPGANTGTFAA